jgi:hypothetical protein
MAASRGAAFVLPAHLQEGRILQGVLPWQQGCVLKHQSDHALPGGFLRREPGDAHLPFSWTQEAGDDFQERAFAATRGPDQRHKAPFGDRKIDAGQNALPLAAVREVERDTTRQDVRRAGRGKIPHLGWCRRRYGRRHG